MWNSVRGRKALVECMPRVHPRSVCPGCMPTVSTPSASFESMPRVVPRVRAQSASIVCGFRPLGVRTPRPHTTTGVEAEAGGGDAHEVPGEAGRPRQGPCHAHPRSDPGSRPEPCRIDLRSVPASTLRPPRSDPESTPGRCRRDLRSTRPRSTPNRPQLGPGSMPDRSRSDPGSTWLRPQLDAGRGREPGQSQGTPPRIRPARRGRRTGDPALKGAFWVIRAAASLRQGRRGFGSR